MKGKAFFLYILVSALSFPQCSKAQSAYEDVVYLKNGSIIRGTIVEQIPNESIKIQSDRNLFVFKMDEVLKITKEEVVIPAEKKAKRSVAAKAPESIDAEKKKFRKISGYINITETSFGFPLGKTETVDDRNGTGPGYIYESRFDKINNTATLGIETINGYQFSHWLILGAGIGMQLYDDLALIPLFLHVQSNLMDSRLSPFIAGEIGNSFIRPQLFVESNWEDKGGFMGSFLLGVKYFVVPSMAINFSLGIRYQEVKIENPQSYYDQSGLNYFDRSMNHLNVRMGITF